MLFRSDGVIIDPVLDYDPSSSAISYDSIGRVLDFVQGKNLKIQYVLETHAHADHLSGAQFIKNKYPNAILAIGANITKVQKTFKHIFNFKDFNENGFQFDRLLEDEKTFQAGSLSIKTLFTPGHTPACVSYLINQEALFTGDVLFMDDYEIGRAHV